MDKFLLAAVTMLLIGLFGVTALYYRERVTTEELTAQLNDVRFERDHRALESSVLKDQLTTFMGTASACEQALANARNDANARATIMRQAKTTTRPPEPTTNEIVDDATRKAAADRLNRPLP